jgi:CHAD domain-containing protein
MVKTLWHARARSVQQARKAFQKADPHGLHDLRVALRRVGSTASALGKKKLLRRSRSLVVSLSPLRQLEIDRRLLARVRALGLLTEEAAAGLDARWDSLFAAGLKKAVRISGGRRMRSLLRSLRRRARRGGTDQVLLLERERGRAERKLNPPSEDASDRELHRFRKAIKHARYVAEDIAACGVRGLDNTIAREKELQEALGRWNDARLFRERLIETRAEAEERGAVSLALELDRLVTALEGTVAAARTEALASAQRLANVLPFLERTA